MNHFIASYSDLNLHVTTADHADGVSASSMGQPTELHTPASASHGKAKVLYDYFASNDQELSLIADEVISRC